MLRRNCLGDIMTFNKCLRCGAVIKLGWEYRVSNNEKCPRGHAWKIAVTYASEME